MTSDIGAEMGGATKAFSQIHQWHRHAKQQLQQLPWEPWRSTKSHWSKGAAKQLIGHYCASWQFGQAPSAVILAWVSGIMSIKTMFSKSELPAHFGKWQELLNKPTNNWMQIVIWCQLSISFEIWRTTCNTRLVHSLCKPKDHQLEGL